MKIFISWSGERSLRFAETLKQWLPDVIQVAEPWISSEDIRKGQLYVRELAGELEHAKFGIVCLTRDNLDSKWIHFEAGAISKTEDAKVCTLLLDISSPTDVDSPLGNFQATTASKEDLFRLVSTINDEIASTDEKQLSQERLERAFERNWPDLEARITEIRETNPPEEEPVRDQMDLLQEVLEIVRGLQRSERLSEDLREVRRKIKRRGLLADASIFQDEPVRYSTSVRSVKPMDADTLRSLREILSPLGGGVKVELIGAEPSDEAEDTPDDDAESESEGKGAQQPSDN